VLGIRNFYVLKQADGTIWNFAYKDNFGIIYRTLEKDSWSRYSILVRNSTKAFSAIILPDNRISVIYQSTSGNLLLKLYVGNEWKDYSVLQKKNNSTNDIHFKIIYALDKIQILYSVLQSHDNMRALFHQSLTIDNGVSISSPIIIDSTNVNDNNQFAVHEISNDSVCILYQKLLNKYELGYKMLGRDNSTWSKFYCMDKNFSPYIDYSLNEINNKPNIMYVKNNGEANSVYCTVGLSAGIEHTKLAEGDKIISCALFKDKNTNYNFWISNSYIHSCYTTNMNASISPIKSEILKTINIIKASYGEIDSESNSAVNDLYVQDGSNLTFLPSDFLTYREEENLKQSKAPGGKISNDASAYYKMSYRHGHEGEEKVDNTEARLTKKDQIINQLNYIIKEERKKVLLLNNKINIIEKNYIDWENEKLQLNKDINSFQEMLILKENRINELERLILDKDTKSSNLNEKINKLSNNSEEYNKKSSEFEAQIVSLNKTIEKLNSDINVLEKENGKIKRLESKSEEYKKKIDELNRTNEELSLKIDNLEEYRNKIEITEKKIEEYKILIEDINKANETLNLKINTLEEEKAALINEKNNTSLFRKLFN
jgi:hypothetical protein